MKYTILMKHQLKKEFIMEKTTNKQRIRVEASVSKTRKTNLSRIAKAHDMSMSDALNQIISYGLKNRDKIFQ